MRRRLYRGLEKPQVALRRPRRLAGPPQPRTSRARAAAKKTPATGPASSIQTPHRFLQKECDAPRHPPPRSRRTTPSAASSCRRTTTTGRPARPPLSRSSTKKGRSFSAGATCRRTTRRLAPLRSGANRSCDRCCGPRNPTPRPPPRSGEGGVPPPPRFGEGAGGGVTGLAFERKLYVIRKPGRERDLDERPRAGRHVLRAEPVVQDAHLQGDAQRRPGDAVFPGPADPDDGVGPGAGPLALQHEHVPHLGRARTRTATSRTTARSTRCAATSTG